MEREDSGFLTLGEWTELASNPTGLTTELSPSASLKLEMGSRERMSLIICEGNSQVTLELRFSIHEMYMVQAGGSFYSTLETVLGEEGCLQGGSVIWQPSVPSHASRAKNICSVPSGLHTKDRNQEAE